MAKRKTTKSAAKKSTKRKRKRSMYRLACVSCDREDYDGISYIPKTWRDVQRYQTLAASLEEVADGDHSRSAFDWFTHMGQCPECQQAEGVI